MPTYFMNRWHIFYYVLYSIFGMFALVLVWYNWVIGLFAFAAIPALIYLNIRLERSLLKELTLYLATISHRVRRAGNEVINELPIAILLYSEEKKIDWHNPHLYQVLKLDQKDTLIGELLYEKVPELKNQLHKEENFEVKIGNREFTVLHRPSERLVYLQDITQLQQLKRKYTDEKLVLGVVMMDNLDELTQTLDDQNRNLMLATVTQEITEWAHANKMYFRRISADKYIIVLNQQILRKLEQTKFDVLDQVREKTAHYKIPMTLSIGIGVDADSLIELGKQAQSSLDIALGRGGDQVAVKEGTKLSFYGGKSNAIEKRTRVRVRVISHGLRDLIKESDRVVIVGHKVPDMDSIGASVGVLKMVKLMGKDGYIILEGINPSIKRLMDEISEHEAVNRSFISPEQAYEYVNSKTLVVVVDTHKGSMLYDSKLLQQTNRVVVIDHHRRGEEIIPNALMVYIEPYASSTSELITELLQYFHDQPNLAVMEATALLSGLVVDTKNFTYRTGARTFEAASYLRRNGADSAMIQRMFKENLDDYLKKADLMRNTEVLYDQLAIVTSTETQVFSPLLVAQVADSLLNMSNIAASFVICKRPDGLVGISARSAGQINVQIVMEQLGGGGHFTNAAVQLETTTADAAKQLKQVLERIQSEEGLFS